MINDSKRNAHLAKLVFLLMLIAFLNACAAIVIGGAAIVASDRRTTGTVLDDQSIEVSVIDHIYGTEGFEGGDHVKVEVYEGVVLLVGEVTSEEKKITAGKRAAEVDNVQRVVNELAVDTSATVGDPGVSQFGRNNTVIRLYIFWSNQPAQSDIFLTAV